MQARDESQTADSPNPYDSPINLDALDLELALRGWTDLDLAKTAGVHRSTLHKMRAAGGHCGKRTKALIARALIEHERAPAPVLAVLGVREPTGS